MNYKNYSLRELADTYLRMVSVEAFYTNRSDIHEAIFKKLGLDEYEKSDALKANTILHNLDKEIGFIIGVEYDERDFEKMSKKLERKLIAVSKEEIVVEE